MRVLVASIVLASLLFGCAADGNGPRGPAEITTESSRAATSTADTALPTPITVASTIGDVIGHPAFAGFGQLVLPLDGSYDDAMPLSQIASLLPYHTNVDPAQAADTLNAMIERIGAGETTFYDFYSAEERAADPSKDATGLFFFRGKPGAPYAVVCPGGGFSYVGSIHESFPHALALSERGYNAFAIKYRVRGGSDAPQMANEDLAAALTFIDEHAEELRVARAGYSIWGSSAGANMAVAISAQGSAALGPSELPKPSAVILAYTNLMEYSEDDPPTFAVTGERDTFAPPDLMRRRINGMRQAGIEAELRVYPGVGHGFGLGRGTSAEGWLEDAAAFWKRQRGRG